MSNLEKYKGFFETDPHCLSAEQIDKYVQEKLEKKAKYQVEKHLLACEFCKEAVEGILSFEKSINLTQTSQQINAQIAEKYLSKKRKTIPLFSYLKVAASLFLLITAGWFVIDIALPDNQSTAFLETKQAFEEESLRKDNHSETDLVQDTNPVVEKMKEDESLKNKQKKRRKDDVRVKKPEDKDKNKKSKNKSNLPKTTSTSAVTLKKEESKKLLDTTINDSEEELDTDGLALDTELTDDSMLEEVVEEEAREMEEEKIGYNADTNLVLTDEMEGKAEGIAFSTQSDTDKAQNTPKKEKKTGKDRPLSLIKSLRKEVKRSPNDLDLRYQYALSYFKVNQFNKSLEQFEKVVVDTSQTHYHDAIWYSSLIKIKQDSSELAKKGLKKLLKNETYRDRAKQKLKEID